jgi:hypothetical protein
VCVCVLHTHTHTLTHTHTHTHTHTGRGSELVCIGEDGMEDGMCKGADGMKDAMSPLPISERTVLAITRARNQEKELTSADRQMIVMMRKLLGEKGFSEADEFFTDEYLHNAMQATKNGKRRTFAYSAEKLQQSLEWRRDVGAAHITRLHVHAALAPNHMWWEGVDIHGRNSPKVCVNKYIYICVYT